MTVSCCDFHHQVECGQGDFCPLRSACLAKRAMPLITENSDGSSAGNPVDELLDDTGLLICEGLALLAFIVSVLAYASFWL